MDTQPQQVTDSTKLQELESFLELNNLPFTDLTLEGNVFWKYCDPQGNMVGSGGLEMYGDVALLRSVAVRQAERSKNLGSKIVNKLLQHAKESGIKSVFLLTETAHDFFLKKGFTDLSRDEVPIALKTSSEFSFVCPASAKCMVYHLS
ncbi:arsenic resistance N-acetyltransferase ArsN2 [Chryseolinea sp. H1M3-3]|uniref:arsenic resistance N-acetyltransferase ArsN2 n=1 Tax=Chryseolinea sp. H1M3-3 TaxID=3034144 RepID=UPI0023EBD593|nr:arsenic resistance N-acetyltransferase ArsN2 [Chryseolinea sp. H1M3-3]